MDIALRKRPGPKGSLNAAARAWKHGRRQNGKRSVAGVSARLLSRRCRRPREDEPVSSARRHRDLLLAVCGVDADRLVNDMFVRFARRSWIKVSRTGRCQDARKDFFILSLSCIEPPPAEATAWQQALSRELADVHDRQLSPLQSVRESLDQLGVPKDEWEIFLASTFLVLRGWAGMTQQVEERRDRVVRPIPKGSLIDFLAIRLLLDRVVVAHTAKERSALPDRCEPSATRSPANWRRTKAPTWNSTALSAFFKSAQFLGWSPEMLSRLDVAQWNRLVNEIEAFSSVARRRVFHLAYEHRFYTQTLDALAIHNGEPIEEPKAPQFQAMFCIDEREESLRRHVEEVAPNAVTFSIAGFYFVDMYYKGLEDAHFTPLCPPVMRPGHWVVETVEEIWRRRNGAERMHARHSARRRINFTLAHGRSFWCIVFRRLACLRPFP